MNLSVKVILTALISTPLIFCGCSKREKVSYIPEEVETVEPVRVLTIDKTGNRNGIIYEINQEEPFTGVMQDFYPKGQKKLEVSFKDGKKHGVGSAWYQNGQKEYAMNWKEGNLHGAHTQWYENGQKECESNYKDGNIHGTNTIWYKNGQKNYEPNYKDGKIHGVYIQWFKSGKKDRVYNFKDGKQHGIQTQWHENGQKKSEEIFMNGLRHGVSTGWHENGQKRHEMSYRKSYPHGMATWWYDNGQKEQENVFSKDWYDNGQKEQENVFSKDWNANGVETGWYKNGQKTYEIHWKDGKKHGIHTEWHKDGQKWREINWNNGAYHEDDMKLFDTVDGGVSPPGDVPPMPLTRGLDMKGWKHVSIPSTCGFQIPPSMEIQAGLYKEVANKYRDSALKGFDTYEIVKSKDRVVIQQAGINKHDEQARMLYCRLIVETVHGDAGDFALTSEDLRDLNQHIKKVLLFKNEALKKQGVNIEVIDWFPATIVEIGGVRGTKISYTRKGFKKASSKEYNPPVMVSTYLLYNNDRMHTITASYRIKEKSKWESDLAKAVNTFTFVKGK